MSDKLQELTNRLYQDGVDKAKTEATAILNEAEARREDILKAAREEAAGILEAGKKSVEEMQSKVEKELILAARQAEGALKQRLVNVLTGNILTEGIHKALNSESFLTDLIAAAVKTWSTDGRLPDISVVLGSEREGKFSESLEAALTSQLGESPTISFSDRMGTGFRVLSKDDGYALSFTEEDFQEYFRSFFKDRTRGYLFG